VKASKGTAGESTTSPQTQMRRSAVLLLSALALAACGGSDSTRPDSFSWVGTWQLTTVNGQPVPATLTSLGYQYRFVSRTLTVHGDGSAVWVDSTESVIADAYGGHAGRAIYSVLPSGDTLYAVVRSGTSSGPVDDFMKFARQPGGSATEVDGDFTSVYRKE
jgi:hypothetical protein